LLWFIIFFCLEISELRRLIATKFCTMLGSAFDFVIPVENFRWRSARLGW